MTEVMRSAGGLAQRRGKQQFMVWAVVASIGFLAVVAVVIALGTRSTQRFEREGRRRPVANPTVPITLPGPLAAGHKAPRRGRHRASSPK
jgi:hypothetical protein